MKKVERSDVLIIGGGPSGLRTAARLAAGGLDVRVLDRKAGVGRDVVCTGIVDREVFARFGLETGSVIRDLRDVRLVSPFGTVVTYSHPRPFACVVDRERFDHSLAAAAAAAGARLSFGCRVEEISVEGGGVEVAVSTDDGGRARCAAALAVIATGVDCDLQKRAGLGRPRDFLCGAQVEVPSLPGEPTSILFGRDVAPGAFAWSVPAGGTVRMGLLARKDAKARLLKLLEDRDGRRGQDAGMSIRTRAVAQGLVNRTAGDRVLSVGEAAGQIKTTTGGGISYGLLCADFAAESILECFRRSSFGAGALAAYELRWRGAIEKEIVVGHYVRRVCARLSDGRIESLFHLAQTDGILPIIQETADFDRHSRLIFALLERLSFMKDFRSIRKGAGRFRPS